MTNETSPLYYLDFWYGSKPSRRFFAKTRTDPGAFAKLRKSLLYMEGQENTP
jgi:hypothetical protein